MFHLDIFPSRCGCGAAAYGAVPSSVPTAGSIRAKALSTQCVDKTAHASIINGLASRFPAYGGAVRLTLHWLAAHMFGDYLSQEAVELLVAVRPCEMNCALFSLRSARN